MIGRLLTRAREPHLQPSAMPYGGPWPFGSTTVETWSPVTQEQALDLAVVSGFTSILTAIVMQMPLRALVGTEEIPRPPILRNPVPMPGRVFGDFCCEYIRDMVLHGNYVAVLGDPSWTGWPDVLYPVPWGQWSIRDDHYYLIGGELYRPEDVFHIRRGCLTGDHMGRGLIETHGRLLAGAVAAESWASLYFEGGTAPPVSVTHPNAELTQAQALDLKSKFRAATRLREAVIVPTGTVVTPLNAQADGAQLIESRRWGAQQLAMALGIPGAMLGLDAPSLTYRNITDVFQQFITTTVMSYLVGLEEQLTSQCLPRGTRARYSTDAVLRPDVAARVGLAVQGLTGGVYTPDEARALLDLAPADLPANATQGVAP